MTALAIITASTPVEEAGAILAYGLAEKSDATRRAYRSDMALFQDWCQLRRGIDALGAPPEAVAAFLTGQASVGVSPATLTRRVAAIGYAHELAGLPSPTKHGAVRAVLRGIRRTAGVAPAQKAPATADHLARMVAAIPADTLQGKRDRALILFGFAGAFRRSKLVALDVADLTFEPEGVVVRIRRSKTDQGGREQEIGIPRGTRLRPVAAVQEWTRAAGIEAGPVFRQVDRHGKIRGRLTAQTVALVVKRHADAAGLDPTAFAGHSLRAGFLTSAADAGADVLAMMEVSRHKRVETVRGYVRRASLFKGHAGAGFL